MSTGISTDLQDFSVFVQAKLKAGETHLSPEEALDLWRMEHPTEEEHAENVRAIQESIDEMNSGAKGVTGEESVRLLREMIKAKRP
jgi:hypothetical protein